MHLSLDDNSINKTFRVYLSAIVLYPFVAFRPGI